MHGKCNLVEAQRTRHIAVVARRNDRKKKIRFTNGIQKQLHIIMPLSNKQPPLKQYQPYGKTAPINLSNTVSFIDY